MTRREETCCFTGHRPSGLPWGQNEYDPRCQRMKDELEARLEGLVEAGYRRFICGMALGCDMMFAEAVLNLRLLHPEVRLEAAVPCADQAGRWSNSQRERYNSLLSRCDQVTVLQQAYTPDCMQRRNRYMVDRSSALLACYSGHPGGTMNTILYARRQGLPCVIIDI